MAQKYAANIYNPSDEPTNIGVNGVPYSDTTITDLVANNPTVFELVENAGGILVLKTVEDVDSVDEYWEFIQSGTSTVYGSQPLPLVGGQPQTPPWLRPKPSM